MANRIDGESRGVYPIAPTPFDERGGIDWDSLDRVIDFYREVSCSGVTVLGLLGEAPKLEASEAISIVKRSVARARDMSVIVGVTAPGFAAMRTLAHASMEAGAAAVMIAPPPSLRTDEQIAGYFASAVDELGDAVPIVLQDYPLVYNVVLTPRIIARIVNTHPSIVMLKHEDWPGLDKISELRRLTAEGEMRKTSIVCGNGGVFLDFELARGADGAMTGYAFPEMLVELCRLSWSGQSAQAHELFDAHLPLIRYEQQPGIGLAVRKYVLKKRGLIASDAQRRPAMRLSEAAAKEIDLLLDRLGHRLGQDPAAPV
jgi:4-hydroxy-tetrahydrodipicolinate synthase